MKSSTSDFFKINLPFVSSFRVSSLSYYPSPPPPFLYLLSPNALFFLPPHLLHVAKLMCDAALGEKDYRAITADETGEFRLWNIYGDFQCTL